jgi:hypothetical protein
MSRMDEIQPRLIQTPAPPDRLIAEFRSEDRAALTEVLNAQRLVRVQLSDGQRNRRKGAVSENTVMS